MDKETESTAFVTLKENFQYLLETCHRGVRERGVKVFQDPPDCWTGAQILEKRVTKAGRCTAHTTTLWLWPRETASMPTHLEKIIILDQ